MKLRNFSFLALIVFMTNNLNAQQALPYTEPFTGSVPSTWFVATPNDQAIMFHNPATSAFEAPNASSSGSLVYNFFANIGFTEFDLRSPVLNNPTGKLKLSFDFAGAVKKTVPAALPFTEYAADYIELEYSTDGGTTFLPFNQMLIGLDGELNTAGFTANAMFHPTTSQWESKTLTLPAGTNRVKFKGQRTINLGAGNFFYLDNVSFSVCETPMPTGDATQFNASYVTLDDLVVTGTDLKFYSDVNGINQLPITTPLVVGTTYYVTQTLNGCEGLALAIQYLDETASVENVKIEDLKIYPNPTFDILNIDTIEEITTVKLFNILGQEINIEATNLKQIDMRNLSSGTYMLQIHFEKFGIKTVKVLKK